MGHGSEFTNFKHKTNHKPIELKIHITRFNLYLHWKIETCLRQPPLRHASMGLE